MEEGREYLKNFEKNDVPGQSVTGNPQSITIIRNPPNILVLVCVHVEKIN